MAKYDVFIDGTIRGRQVEIDPSTLTINNRFKFSSEHKGQLDSDNLLENVYLFHESKVLEGTGVRELYFKTTNL